MLTDPTLGPSLWMKRAEYNKKIADGKRDLITDEEKLLFESKAADDTNFFTQFSLKNLVPRDPDEEIDAVADVVTNNNISYDQLRDRLPPEISDDIVLLLSQSYEAFADFAEIQTQADVNEFNIKYNVQLFLPQQSGA